jgi:hypothetical protein
MHQQSPLAYFLNAPYRISDIHIQIDTLRTLLLDFDTIDDFSAGLAPFRFENLRTYLGARDIETTQWLWINAALVFHGTELIKLRARLLHTLIFRHNCSRFPDSDTEIYQVLTKLMDKDMVAEYLKGTYAILLVIFWQGTSVDSKRRGDFYLSLLATLHLDVETCVAKELEHYPGGLIVADPGYGLKRRLIFEKDEVQRPTLKWEWVYDSYALGYHVVFEFCALTNDTSFVWGPLEWPFHECYCQEDPVEYFERLELNKSKRFDRRTAAKARKERARTGQKRSRSKMPGTWDW